VKEYGERRGVSPPCCFFSRVVSFPVLFLFPCCFFSRVVSFPVLFLFPCCFFSRSVSFPPEDAMNDRITDDPSDDGVERRWADDPDPQVDWYLNWLSSVHEMAVFIDAVVTVMVDLGYPRQDIFGTQRALDEAVGKAIKHGHENDPTRVVEIRYRPGADHFLVEAADQGPGFDPSPIPAATIPENRELPCGRGLLLMRHYAAWVRHDREENCVTFCICRSAPLPAQPAAKNSPANSWTSDFRNLGNI
jgi:serine/threonine-protein kinase RsbW